MTTDVPGPQVHHERAQKKERQYAQPGQNEITVKVAAVIQNMIANDVVVAAGEAADPAQAERSPARYRGSAIAMRASVGCTASRM